MRGSLPLLSFRAYSYADLRTIDIICRPSTISAFFPALYIKFLRQLTLLLCHYALLGKRLALFIARTLLHFAAQGEPPADGCRQI